VRRLLIGVALLLGACQQGPAAQVPKINALSAVEQRRAEGDAFLAKADYVNAIEKYRQAADLDPAAIAPRFALPPIPSSTSGLRPSRSSGGFWITPPPVRPSTKTLNAG
jgi:hypothetical protein